MVNSPKTKVNNKTITKILVNGTVQGVFFRIKAKNLADKLNLIGFAQNLPNGQVHLEIFGLPKSVKQFINWCHQGSKYSSVTDVQITTIENFSRPILDSFQIF